MEYWSTVMYNFTVNHHYTSASLGLNLRLHLTTVVDACCELLVASFVTCTMTHLYFLIFSYNPAAADSLRTGGQDPLMLLQSAWAQTPTS